MAFPVPEKISPGELDSILERLELLLRHLPLSLPLPKTTGESQYALFLNFNLDQELLEKTGDEIAALGEQLEQIFGWKARTSGDGVLPICERGDAICALQPLLKHFCKKYPSNNIIKKWIIDVAIGAEKVYEVHGVKIPELSEVNARKRALSTDQSEIATTIKKSKSSKTLVQTNTSFGRPTGDLMSQLIIKYTSPDGKKSWGCVAPDCKYLAQGNASLPRVLKHASKCKALSNSNHHLYQKVLAESADTSLGGQLAPSPALSQESTTETGVTPANQKSHTAKKTQSNTLNTDALRAAGAKRKAQETKQFQVKVNHIIMRLICVRGLVPNLIDSPEWHELMTILNPQYKITSSTTFTEDYIPKEAVLIRKWQTELLQKERNLTLTFDGTTVRKPQSLYTAHATTSARQTYFLDGHEGSDERHTTEWIQTKLTQTIESIGVSRWGAVCSDSTNVTKAARRELASATQTIVDLNDCVHHIHNTIKDITTLEDFKVFISGLRSMIKHFSKSSYSTALLENERVAADDPIKNLQKIGKTRFGSIWTASTALDPCLSMIRKMTQDKQIKFKSTKVQGMLSSRSSGNFIEFETMPYDEAYQKVKECLKAMLRKTFAHIKQNPEGEEYMFLIQLGEAGAAAELKRQLEAWWKGEWPFLVDEKILETIEPRSWWEQLELNPHARTLAFLAIKIFSILVNSMPDERTNSTFTWLNSSLRGNQKARTLVDMIQINQWYGMHQDTNRKSKRARPAVKFRNIDANVLQRLQAGLTATQGDGENQMEESQAANDEDGSGETSEDEEELPAVQDAFPMKDKVSAFEVEAMMDLDSLALMDMISEKPLITKDISVSQPLSEGVQAENENVWDF